MISKTEDAKNETPVGVRDEPVAQSDDAAVSRLDESAVDEPQEIIEIRDSYFLGQEDRNFITHMYGQGDYLYRARDEPGTKVAVTLQDARLRTVIDRSGQVYKLLSEPDAELFQICVGNVWDVYKSRFVGCENYSDYVPGMYLSFTAFANSDIMFYDS